MSQWFAPLRSLFAGLFPDAFAAKETPPEWLKNDGSVGSSNAKIQSMIEDSRKKYSTQSSITQGIQKGMDALNKSFANINAQLNKVSAAVDKLGSLFSCGAGCIASPINAVVGFAFDIVPYPIPTTPAGPPFLKGPLGFETRVGASITGGACVGAMVYTMKNSPSNAGITDYLTL